MTERVDELAERIEAGDEAVVAELSKLDDATQPDCRDRSLMDVAIASGHHAAVEALAERPGVLVSYAPVEEDLKTPLRHMLAEMEVEWPIDALEARLRRDWPRSQLGEFARTPLLMACRHADAPMIASLLRAGAKLNDKDLLNLGPLALSFYGRGPAGIDAFVEAMRAAGVRKRVAVSVDLLRDLLAYPKQLDSVMPMLNLNAACKRLLFAWHCARLDGDAVARMLADGLDINKAITNRYHPVVEVCTGELIWSANLPGLETLAYHRVKYSGPPGTHSISIDNDRINEDGSNLGALMAEAERERKKMLEWGKKLQIDPATERDLFQRRCALIDQLLDAGLDRDKAQDLLDEDFFDELEEMGQSALADHLRGRGFDGGSDEQASDDDTEMGAVASTHWELSVETLLTASLWKVEGNTLLRAQLSNPYGPIDDVELALSVGEDDWQPLICLRETIQVDDEMIPRDDLDEPAYGEHLWQADFECPLPGIDKALHFRISSETVDGLNGELDAWQPS